ncbi:MAG TPA: EamA family transporter [Blastocatellia bacterium]|jgi:drug/metabolite transporter (DMT)-like permease|nr:EamA family transporter [Blastocatellia bacterium]
MKLQETGNTKIDQKDKVVLLIAAFAAVYILWGSTYLAIKYVIETLPSLISTGTRFLLAGSTLFLIGRFSKSYEKPTLKQWRASVVAGILLFLGGTGGVVLAEHHITSSLAALLVATEPFWVVLLSWLWLKGARPDWKVALGLLIGFAGVYLLIGGAGASGNGIQPSAQPIGVFLVIAAALCWATGSIYGVRAPVPKSPIMASGMQMLAGGSSLILVGTLTGEWTRFEIAAVSLNSVLALAYLLVFGSLITFTAYSWLLKNARPAMVATYAYVNPVIAVVLGWAFAGESFTGRMLLGAAVIVGSVVLITSPGSESIAEEKIDLVESPMENCPT